MSVLNASNDRFAEDGRLGLCVGGCPKCSWRIILLAFALAAAGCAARPTGYVDASGALKSPYGYSVTPMGSDEYSILVRANYATPAERVAQIALLRAAHLTVEKSAAQFSIIHAESLAYQFQRLDSVRIRGAFIPVGTSSDENKLAALVIHVWLPGTAPVGPQVINAQQVVGELGPKLQP